MDVLKASIYALVVMMCINAVSLMTTTIGITNNVAYNATQVIEALDASAIVDSWGWEDNPFYDIATGLLSYWFRSIPVIEEFPYMLAAYGCPNFIYIPLHTVWRMMWVIVVSLTVIAGRQT